MPLRPLIRFNFFLINCFFFAGAIFCVTTMSGFFALAVFLDALSGFFNFSKNEVGAYRAFTVLS
jgi:hypothetical protein